jgi:2-polyprenyl-3-methyl-5-hydroxy-6-metoxy-1,4-benzoquinol methylase
VDRVKASHEQRIRYYEWYARGWLPGDKESRILDIGCGAGQFVYFLKKKGYAQSVGIDLDEKQIELARSLDLNCECIGAVDFLEREETPYAAISLLEVLEHFQHEEMFKLLSLIASRLAKRGCLILSVPNAESPQGLHARYADITHEIAFTPESLTETLLCHGLHVKSLRDPWPAPVDPLRKAYRMICHVTRGLEGFRLRLLGLARPRIWSPVLWALAEK